MKVEDHERVAKIKSRVSELIPNRSFVSETVIDGALWMARKIEELHIELDQREDNVQAQRVIIERLEEDLARKENEYQKARHAHEIEIERREDIARELQGFIRGDEKVVSVGHEGHFKTITLSDYEGVAPVSPDRLKPGYERAHVVDDLDESETVHHPAHYGGEDNPYETIKVIEAQGWGKEFCLGNALKYISRAGKKPDVSEERDLRAAAWYLGRAILQLQRMT